MKDTDYYNNIDLGDENLTTDVSKSSEIKVGIIDSLGDIVDVVTLEDLARTGDQQQLFMSNYGRVDEVVYELWTPRTELLFKKLGHCRMLQATGKVASSKIYNLDAERGEQRNYGE